MKQKTYSRENYLKNREKILDYQKRYYLKNLDKMRLRNRECMKKWRANNPEKTEESYKRHYLIQKSKGLRRKYAKKRYEKYQERLKSEERVRNKKQRMEVLVHYGGNPPKCACCKEDIYEFLAIDHVNGGGRKHRKESHYHNLCKWLIRNNYPVGFQILCHNCNSAKGFYGICPHKK